MTNYMGPINITVPHVKQGDEVKRDGSEVINIVCSPEEAKLIQGLCEDSVKNSYGPIRVVSGNQSRWGIIPIDTSENLNINEAQTHKGLYQLLDTTIEEKNPSVFLMSIQAEKLTNNPKQILTMLHSFGGEDGSSIPMSSSYSDLETETLLDDDFTTFDTTDTWEAKYAENMAAGNTITATGNKLVFTGASGTNWTWGYLWTILQDTVPDDFTAELTLEWDALPASGAAEHHINLFLVDGRPSNKTEIEYKDVIRIMLRVKDTGTTLELGKRVRGVDSALITPITLGATEKTPAIKFKLSGGTGQSNLTVWVDQDYTSGTPSFTDSEIVFGSADEGAYTGVNFDLGRYFVLSQENASSTSATTRVGPLNLYLESDAIKPNNVILPPMAVGDQTATFTRPGVGCDIQCIKNPTSFPTFQLEPEYFYQGGVTAWNGNYTDSTYRQITNNEFDLDPLLFYMDNTLIKLTTIANGVTFSHWNGTAWADLNTFTFPNDISLIKPFLVTPMVCTIQIDRTLWTMRAGKPHIWVKHPTTALGYTLKSCYYHDASTTTDPAADADITMATQFYTNVWSRGTGTCASPSPSDQYRLQIISPEPRTIKSDSIPAAELTGIGVYDATIVSTSDDSYLYRAREWFNPTWQKIVLEGVI